MRTKRFPEGMPLALKKIIKQHVREHVTLYQDGANGLVTDRLGNQFIRIKYGHMGLQILAFGWAEISSDDAPDAEMGWKVACGRAIHNIAVQLVRINAGLLEASAPKYTGAQRDVAARVLGEAMVKYVSREMEIFGEKIVAAGQMVGIKSNHEFEIKEPDDKGQLRQCPYCGCAPVLRLDLPHVHSNVSMVVARMECAGCGFRTSNFHSTSASSAQDVVERLWNNKVLAELEKRGSWLA